MSCWHDSGLWQAGLGWGAHPGGAPCTATQVRTRWRQEGHFQLRVTCLEACTPEGPTPALQVPMGPAGFFHRVIKCQSPRGRHVEVARWAQLTEEGHRGSKAQDGSQASVRGALWRKGVCEKRWHRLLLPRLVYPVETESSPSKKNTEGWEHTSSRAERIPGEQSGPSGWQSRG